MAFPFQAGDRVRDLKFGKGEGTVEGLQKAYGRTPDPVVVWVNFDNGHSAGRYRMELEHVPAKGDD